MRKFYIMALTALMALAINVKASAAEDYSKLTDVKVINECDTTWHFGYKGINFYSRDMHRIDIAYPSVDINGDSIMLSGSIVIPGNVYNGKSPCDGVILYNRYTQTVASHAPSSGFAEGEFVFMCTPLQPNWILVESDFYGFGITTEHVADQYYVYGDANGHANIDCLIGARKVLNERSISQGKFLLNVGISSGGYDAMATQRVRDTEFSNVISFDKSIIGAAPFNLTAAYNEYLKKKDDESLDIIFALVVINCVNKFSKLGYTKQQLFTEPLASKFDEWICSGKYDTDQIRDSLHLTGKKLTDFVQPAFLDPSTEELKTLTEALKAKALDAGWTPDKTQRYFYLHYRHDKAVPCESGRAFLKFLTDNGFKKSVIPELTDLNTCMFVLSDSHSISGIHFMLHVAATLTAYPVLYYDGELNTHYYDLIKEGTPMGIIKTLEKKGIDVAGIYKALTTGDGKSGSGIDFFSLMTKLNDLNATLKNWGTDISEVLAIADDCGLSITDIMEIVQYLNAQLEEREKTNEENAASARAMIGKMAKTQQLPGVTDTYYNILLDWLDENNVDLNEIKFSGL